MYVEHVSTLSNITHSSPCQQKEPHLSNNGLQGVKYRSPTAEMPNKTLYKTLNILFTPSIIKQTSKLGQNGHAGYFKLYAQDIKIHQCGRYLQ
jgi:hypothetical protein